VLQGPSWRLIAMLRILHLKAEGGDAAHLEQVVY